MSIKENAALNVVYQYQICRNGHCKLTGKGTLGKL